MRRDPALVCALAVVMLTVSSAPSGAQATATGPFIAPSGWAQKLPCDTLAACQRFTLLSNWDSEAVLDRETGLVWQRAPKASNRVWVNASFNCVFQTTGGRFGWRLPTIQELLSLGVPDSNGRPSLPPGSPFVLPVPSSGFWSSTTQGYPPEGGPSENAFGFDYVTGVVTILAKGGADGQLQAWCVRGSGGLDGQ